MKAGTFTERYVKTEFVRNAGYILSRLGIS